MFQQKTTENQSIIKKVSIVESFYNPLTTEIQQLYKKNWLLATGKKERTFYERLKKPYIIDYALILFTLEIKGHEFIINHYEYDFKGCTTINQN